MISTPHNELQWPPRLYVFTVSARRRGRPEMTMATCTIITGKDLPGVRHLLMDYAMCEMPITEYYGYEVSVWLDITSAALAFAGVIHSGVSSP